MRVQEQGYNTLAIMQSWKKDLIIGAIGAILGWALTVGWDVYKYREETEKRDAALISLLRRQLDWNRMLAEEDATLARREIQLISKNQGMLVQPLKKLDTEAWTLIKLNLPVKLEQNPEMLWKLEQVFQLTEETNEMLRSREQFKVTSEALSSYADGIRAYDELLVPNCERLAEQFRLIYSAL